MAQFSEVFSTTAKVVGALVIISAIGGIGYFVLGAAGSAVTSPKKSEATHTAAADYLSETDKAADSRRTTMPASTWNHKMARASKFHCYTPGMNQHELVQSLGEPTQKKDDSISGGYWIWQLSPGKCLKYDGDRCVEQEKREATIFFTAKGNVSTGLPEYCRTIEGRFIFPNPLTH